MNEDGMYAEDTQAEQPEDRLDPKAAQDINKRNSALAGGYVTDVEAFGELTVNREVRDDGRRVTAFFGRVRSTRRGHEDVTNVVRFRLSQDARPKKDADGNEVEGKDDLQTRLYAEAFRAYVSSHDDTPPGTMKELTDWVAATDGLRLNTMSGDAGDLIVLHVQAPR